MDTHPAEYLQTAEGKKLPVEHCIKGSPGWGIVPQLQSFAALAKAVSEMAAQFGSMKAEQERLAKRVHELAPDDGHV